MVFIVVAVGAGGTGFLLAAGLGAFAALLIVAALGLALHRPLARVPENTLKFIVGVILSGFGVFWLGEGMGLRWPDGDAFDPRPGGGVRAGRPGRRAPLPGAGRQGRRGADLMAWLVAVGRELWSLFVDDVGLAAASLIWIGLVWLAGRWLGTAAGPALFAGLAVILVVSALRRAGSR